MKVRHRIPVEAIRLTDPVTPEYEAEVLRDTARAERDYAKAEARLRSAEAKLHRLQQQARPKRRELLVARELVEMRRQELLDVQRQMQGAPASAEHRSKREHHRPVIPMRTL